MSAPNATAGAWVDEADWLRFVESCLVTMLEASEDESRSLGDRRGERGNEPSATAALLEAECDKCEASGSITSPLAAAMRAPKRKTPSQPNHSSSDVTKATQQSDEREPSALTAATMAGIAPGPSPPMASTMHPAAEPLDMSSSPPYVDPIPKSVSPNVRGP